MSQWTTEKPTTPGWYWWRRNNEAPKVLEIKEWGDGYLDAHGVGLVWSVNNLDGEWQGPIVPEEAKP